MSLPEKYQFEVMEFMDGTLASKLVDGLFVITGHPDTFGDDLEKVREIAINDDIPKVDNYTKDRFVLEDQLAVSLAFMEDRPVGMSSLFRSDFYPESCARMLNRYYIAPEIREPRTPRGIISPLTFAWALQQLDFGNLLHPEIKYYFTSREIPGKRVTETAARNMNKLLGGEEWQHSKKLHLVCPNPKSKACWQYVMWNGGSDFPMLEKTIKEEQWLKLDL